MREAGERQFTLRRSAVLMALVGAIAAAADLADGQPPWTNTVLVSAFACGASCWAIAAAGASRLAAWIAGGLGLLVAVLALWRAVVR